MTTSPGRQQLSDDSDLFLDSLRDIVGAAHVLTDPAKVPGYVVDWTGRWEGAGLAVVRPGSIEEVAAVVAVCRQANVPIIPHGRITARGHGSIPAEGSVVVSTGRLNRSKRLGRGERAVTRSHRSVSPLGHSVRADGDLTTRHH